MNILTKPKTFKELVRQNLCITKEVYPGTIWYHVFAKKPGKDFLRGASPDAIRAITSIMPDNLKIGDAKAHLFRFKQMQKDSTLMESGFYQCGLRVGIKDNNLVAEFGDLFPFSNMQRAEKFYGRGVGGFVHDYVLIDLKKRGVKMVVTVDAQPGAIPLLLKRKWVRVAPDKFFKKI